jgi:xylulokinase
MGDVTPGDVTTGDITAGDAGDVTVGIDIGTTSVKAVAVDAEGRVVARSRVAHGTRSPAPGTLEHDVDRAWRGNVRRAWREVSQGAADAGAGPVRAVQVAAMVPSLGAVDARGRAVGPGLLYGDIRGGAAQGKSPAESGEWAGFLRFLAAAHPDAAGYWPAQAVANHALGGVGVIDSTTAMCALPVFDFTGWDAAVCAESGARPEQLPEVSPGATPVATVAASVGGPSGALLGGGTIDALGEQWVAGADEPGDVLVICGASLITWAVTDAWLEVPGLWTVPHTSPGRCLVGGPSNAGGIFVDWVRGLVGPDRVGRAGEARPGDVVPSDVPVWAPYLKGERTPLHDPGRRAELVGLSVTHGRAHVWRAAYEATGFVVRHHLERAGVDARRIVATGGGSRSAPWMAALADTTGLPVDVVAVPEGAALGAAFLARVTAGLEGRAEDAARWARTARRVEPDAGWQEHVDGRYRRFLARSGP